MMDTFLRWNLGLGDAIICNGLVRWLVSRGYRIVLPVLPKNHESLRVMFKDNPSVGFVIVNNADEERWQADKSGYAIPIGDSHPSWDSRIGGFDAEFYKQVELDFNIRWDWFFVPRCREREIHNGYKGYAFIHDDAERGWSIPDPMLPVFRPAQALCIFDYYPAIMEAAEIHCIDSAFACWIDSMPENGQKLYFHNIKPIADQRSRLTRRRKWIEV